MLNNNYNINSLLNYDIDDNITDNADNINNL